MIVVVEGPSAAGKTTRCTRHVGRFVPEYSPTGGEPDGEDRLAQADYWVQINCGRWREALRVEQESGTAVCDSVPLKLHYSWCLARSGVEPRERFDQELVRVRQAFQRAELGLPDVALISVPVPGILKRHRDGDATRSRRHFELHRRLAEPVREWYAAMRQLDPARVLWGLPEMGLAGLPLLAPRPGRSDPDLLDGLIRLLPDVG